MATWPPTKPPHRIRLRDESGFLTVTYFRGNEDMLKRMWPIAQTRLVSGVIGMYDGMRQMLHPDHVVDPAKGEAPPAVEPVYPLTAACSAKRCRKQFCCHLMAYRKARSGWKRQQ